MFLTNHVYFDMVPVSFDEGTAENQLYLADILYWWPLTVFVLSWAARFVASTAPITSSDCGNYCLGRDISLPLPTILSLSLYNCHLLHTSHHSFSSSMPPTQILLPLLQFWFLRVMIARIYEWGALRLGMSGMLLHSTCIAVHWKGKSIVFKWTWSSK